MKEIDFIGSENVVIMESSKKISLLRDLSINEEVLCYLPQSTKKFILIQKKIKAINHYSIFSKNFKAMPREISTRINN